MSRMSPPPRPPPKVPAGRHAVLVQGVRTPFLKSHGGFRVWRGHDLGREAVASLLLRSHIEADVIGLVVMGSVLQEPQTSNVAREIALGAGVSPQVPAFTTTLACISANVAATTVVEQIRGGHIDVGIAGGVETFSDPPIRLSRALRQALVDLQKTRGPRDWLSLLKRLHPSDIRLDIPSAAEFSTGQTMGQSCERFAKTWSITRAASDAYALQSHQRAASAWAQGLYDDEVQPVQVPPQMQTYAQDNGPRGDSNLETLARLRPAFDPEFGILSAASSSFFSDGGAALLLCSESQAQKLGLAPLSLVRDYVYGAGDPRDELLLGPALTIPRLLERNGLQAEDIDVWEIHEAFAAQVLANLKAMASTEFLSSRFGRAVGGIHVPAERLNAWGGSLSLGHPFGATGARLLLTASRRLQYEQKRYAVVSGCAAGGQGSAILLENIAAA